MDSVPVQTAAGAEWAGEAGRKAVPEAAGLGSPVLLTPLACTVLIDLLLSPCAGLHKPWG